MSSLHSLVLDIKALEQELGCHLKVVHVPGTLMITQGTDGLSRGLWFAPERRVARLNQRLFPPVPLSSALRDWAQTFLQVPGPVPICDFQHDQVERVTKGWSIWAPPPECARQVIVHYLHRWVQTPMTMGAIFLVPRILQGRWGRICRYVVEMGVFHASLLPPGYAFEVLLPFVVLVIRPHQHALRRPRNRMERPALSHHKKWHLEQAEAVRGLS